MPAAIGYALFLAGAPLGLVNFVTIGFGASLITTALGVGLSVAASLLTGALGQRAPKPSDGQLEIRQAITPRHKSYGKVRLSGPVWISENDHAASDTLYLGLVLNHGLISSFEEFFVDENQVTLQSDGAINEAPYDSPQCYILTRLGLATETEYSEITAAFGVSDMRGDRVATMLGLFNDKGAADDQIKAYPNGKPELRATIKASLCYDPRDSSQQPNDPTTWAWSENAVVCLLTYLIDPDGYGLSWERIVPNLAQWLTAIDVADEDVATISGVTEKRYRLAGGYDLSEAPKDVLPRFLSACDGRVWQKRDGSIGIAVGKVYSPTVSLSDEHILSYELTKGQDRLKRVGGVRADYLSRAHDYREQEAEPWPSDDVVTELSDDRVSTLDLTWVPSLSQARRLMKRAYLRANADWQGTIVTNLAGLRAMDETVIELAISELQIDGVFEVKGFTLDPSTMQCQIAVASLPDGIDEWNAAEEQGSSPRTSPFIDTLVDGTLYAPIGNLTASGGLASCFDGDASKAAAAGAQSPSAVTDGYVGLTFPEAKTCKKAIVYASNNEGFISGSGPSVSLFLYGKSGSAPASATDGTLLDTAVITDNSSYSNGITLTSADKNTTYNYVWVDIQTAVASTINCAQLALYE